MKILLATEEEMLNQAISRFEGLEVVEEVEYAEVIVERALELKVDTVFITETIPINRFKKGKYIGAETNLLRICEQLTDEEIRVIVVINERPIGHEFLKGLIYQGVYDIIMGSRIHIDDIERVVKNPSSKKQAKNRFLNGEQLTNAPSTDEFRIRDLLIQDERSKNAKSRFSFTMNSRSRADPLSIERVIRIPEAVTFPHKVITIMNIHPRAGAKFIATNLARILSDHGFHNGVIEFDLENPKLYELLDGDQFAPKPFTSWHKQVDENGYVHSHEQWEKDKTTWIPVGKQGIDDWGVEETIRILLYAKQAPILFCVVSSYDNKEVINELMRVANEIWFVTEDSIVQINSYLRSIEEDYMKHYLDKSIIIGNKWSNLIKDLQKRYQFDHIIKDFGPISKKAEFEGQFLFDVPEYKNQVIQEFLPLVERIIPGFKHYNNKSKKGITTLFRRIAK